MELLLILSAMIVIVMGQARCPSTITYNKQHTFILSSLTEQETRDRRPEALYKEAAEACYKDCNFAEIMSFSTSYWKHRSPMTILDRAAKFLIEEDFIQINNTYFVNHIAIENEGPVGLGCFALETPSEFSLYSLDEPVCSSTRSVICGMPGIDSTVDNQKIANAIYTLGAPIDTNNSSDTINPDDGKKNDTVVHLPSAINLAEMITSVNVNDTTGTNFDMTDVDEEKRTIDEEKNEISFFGQDQEIFSIGGEDLHYSVIQLLKDQDDLSSVSSLCDNKMGSLSSSSIPNFSMWLQRVHPSTKIIIESWNGDSYGAKDTQCLMFSPPQGVHLSKCAEASTVLCEG